MFVKFLHEMSCDVRKSDFCICENKDADQLRGKPRSWSAPLFSPLGVQSLCFLSPKFQASSHLLWLYSPVCVGPGRKPRRLVFWRRISNHVLSGMNLTRFFLFIFCHVCRYLLELPRSDSNMSRVMRKLDFSHGKTKEQISCTVSYGRGIRVIIQIRLMPYSIYVMGMFKNNEAFHFFASYACIYPDIKKQT